MGRVLKREIIGITCELATPRGRNLRCQAFAALSPAPAGSVWEDQVLDLARVVDLGWALVLTPLLRSYCQEHADRALECTCRTHPERKHLCVAHSDTNELIWNAEHVPADVTIELERLGRA